MAIEWAPFEYLDFWDYPRILVVVFDGTIYLLDSPFDEVADEYPDEYALKILTRPPGSGSWADLGSDVHSVASLGIVPELFDKTRRRSIRIDLIRGAIRGAQPQK